MLLSTLLQDIINTQNNAMNRLYQFIRKDFNYRLEEEKLKVRIPEVTENGILKTMILDAFSIAEDYTFYKLGYGNEGKREFNINLLNDEIFYSIFERKKIISDEINFIKYHFEICKENRLISELRKRIPQENPPPILMDKFKKTFNAFTKENIDYLRPLQVLLYVILNQELNKCKFDEEIYKIYNENSNNWKLNQKLEDILLKLELTLNKISGGWV
jgi:hypothetical protein